MEVTPTPKIIGIAGASCSGKTTLAARLAQCVPDQPAAIISLDSYYRDLSRLSMEERAVWNFDAPAALDEVALFQDLRRLREGKPADIPVYDFATHTRAERVEHVESKNYIIVEGLFILYWPEIRDLLSAKIFIAVPDEVCLSRRIERDIRERGRTEDSVRTQYAATVFPMYKEHCEPTGQFADLRLSGEDPVDDLAEMVLRMDL